MKIKIDGIAIFLFAAAVVLGLAVGRQDERHVLARQWIGSSLQAVPLGGGLPAFRSYDDDRAVLFFEQPGAQGPVHGAVILSGDKIESVLITQSNEGINRRALHDEDGFLLAFFGKTARVPVVVDAISGATISSQLVINAVNERLQRWENYVKRNAGYEGSF